MVRGFINVLIGLKINVYNWFDTREYDECRIEILKVSIRELGSTLLSIYVVSPGDTKNLFRLAILIAAKPGTKNYC